MQTAQLDVISQWQGEPKEHVISLVLTHLPLLKPSNAEAKSQYMCLLPRILAHTIEHGRHLEESRQLLSYALIHPATSLEDRAALALWLNHLEERAATTGDALERPSPAGLHLHQSTLPSTLTSSGSSTNSSSGNLYTLDHHHRNRVSGLGGGWQQHGCENGHLPLYTSSSVTATINTLGTGGGCNTIVTSGGSNQPDSPLKRSVSLTPPMSGPSNHPMGPVWLSQEDVCSSRGTAPDHAPLSPQSSIASSGSGVSEHLEEASLGGGLSLYRSSFHEEGSGMRDVPAWLKSLRLHKYAALFSTMIYDEMMSLTEEQLEVQKVTKGARHKIVISIQKLKERQNMLRSLEKDVQVLEGSNLRIPLQELHQMIMTPIKPFSGGKEPSLQHTPLKPNSKGPAPDSHRNGVGETEANSSVIAEGDLPSQFTRVMGKVCTQLLVSRSDEDNISSYLQLIDKCLIHESFSESQKKRLLTWKQQVQRLFRSIPRKTLLDFASYRPQRSNCGLGQSNSLPTTSCVGSNVMARRSLQQFQMPSRSLPGARLGLLGSSGLLGPTPCSSSSSNNSSTPARLKQGRQGLWFANPGGSNSMPSQTHSSVQRTRSLPVHTTPQTMVMIQQADLTSHVKHVREVLQQLLHHHLYVNMDKCKFHRPSVSFLGFILAEGEDPGKIDAVLQWPAPSCRTEVQRFIGFANFYREFIRNFSSIAAPLHALTSPRNTFEWTRTCQEAFNRLKTSFTTVPILIMPDPDRQFVVEVDASDSGIGAVVSQRCAKDGRIHPCALEEALRDTQSPAGCPPGHLFVGLSLRGDVIAWAHTNETVCHPGMAKTRSVVTAVLVA
ncbi:protein Smaug homolog 1 isoform X3 [Syngnathoides biaculeatus]|uniref:protein Smaug homolog 1 isoform X3 n=1 Tax=Syngnathoides biaculeatus TaxID=300417 RepID=UPI002ADDD3B1|nr:protein Smaug homolog 1 isoform X3 [Syngnathoides biaculeatus]